MASATDGLLTERQLSDVKISHQKALNTTHSAEKENEIGGGRAHMGIDLTATRQAMMGTVAAPP